VSHADARHYQPTNITFGIMPPPDADAGSGKGHGKKMDRKLAISARALRALEEWQGRESGVRS
jgi:folate-dependent tRNA-U54 methylase TrmFO/GidA